MHNNMDTSNNVAENFLKELEAESGATRKCLERIPESLYTWKPHEKSMSMQYLALIVAEVPKWIATMVTAGEIDFATFEHPNPKTTAEMVQYFDDNMTLARQALSGASNELLEQPFSLKNDGQVLMTMPKKDNIGPSINHLVHHRGQLTVFMRLNNLPVPSIYGPSADDQGF